MAGKGRVHNRVVLLGIEGRETKIFTFQGFLVNSSYFFFALQFRCYFVNDGCQFESIRRGSFAKYLFSWKISYVFLQDFEKALLENLICSNGIFFLRENRMCSGGIFSKCRSSKIYKYSCTIFSSPGNVFSGKFVCFLFKSKPPENVIFSRNLFKKVTPGKKEHIF